MSFLSGLGDLFIEMGQAGQEGAKAYEGARRWQDEFGLMKRGSDRADKQLDMMAQQFSQTHGLDVQKTSAYLKQLDAEIGNSAEYLKLAQGKSTREVEDMKNRLVQQAFENKLAERQVGNQERDVNSMIGFRGQQGNALAQDTLAGQGLQADKMAESQAVQKYVTLPDPAKQAIYQKVAQYSAQGMPNPFTLAMQEYAAQNINVLSGKLDGMQRYTNPGRFLGADPMVGQQGQGVGADTSAPTGNLDFFGPPTSNTNRFMQWQEGVRQRANQSPHLKFFDRSGLGKF